MIFPEPVSGGDITRARSDFYWSRTYVCINDNEVIFRAQVATAVADTIILDITYDSVDIGAFGDVIPGMTVFISPTTSPRDAIYRGRVADVLTSDTLPIDENATTLEVGYYLIVIADAELKKVVRRGDLRDGRFAWTDLPPMIDGLPGCIVLYDSDANGTVTVTPSQTGVPVADGATIVSWAWVISGGGTNSISNPAIAHPLLTFEAGYHYLVSVVVTDSNGTPHRQFMHVYAITRTFTAPVVLPVVTGNYGNDLDNGFNASLTAYGGVNTQIDASHVAVFKVERWGDNTSAAVVSNLRFTGRLRNESIQTSGSAEAGQLQQVSFTAEGLTAQMSHLSSPNDIVRNVATPDEFGEMTDPTVYRMLVYYLSTYSTLLSLGGFTAGDNETLDWLVGGEPVSIDGGYIKDVITSVGERIHAAPNYAPDGSIHIEQLASYKQDRSGIPTIMDFALTDLRDYTLDRDTSRTTAQVTAYGGAYDSTAGVFVLYTASAPSVPYGDGEVRESNRELLTTDATTTDTEAELKNRCGNDFAYNNSKPLLHLLLRDCWNWLMASGYQRYTGTIPASSNTRGIAYTNADYWQLQSVNVQVNPDGTDEVTGDLVAETEFTDAQSIASQLPDNATPPNPVFPVLSDYPAFPDDSLWGYPTDTPTDGELQSIDPYSGFVAYSPFPPDQAAEAGRNQGTTRCKTFQVLARNPGTTLSPFVLPNGIDYTAKITGSVSLGTGDWLQHMNFLTSPGSPDPFTADNNFGAVSIWTGGTGWVAGVGAVKAVDIHLILSASTTDVTALRFQYNNGKVGAAVNITLRLATVDVYTDVQAAVVGTVETYFATPGGGFPEFDEIVLQLSSPDTTGTPMIITGFTAEGTGTNPFTGTPATGLSADFYYKFDPNDETNVALFEPTEGGLLDGSKPAVIPPYNTAHEYSVPYEGTGNAVQGAFALADYSTVQNLAFTIQLCRNP